MWVESEGGEHSMSCNATLVVSLAGHSDISVLTPHHSPAEQERDKLTTYITEQYMAVTCS